eukprot:4959489-Pleurochrysis_carterae.AAC.1
MPDVSDVSDMLRTMSRCVVQSYAGSRCTLLPGNRAVFCSLQCMLAWLTRAVPSNGDFASLTAVNSAVYLCVSPAVCTTAPFPPRRPWCCVQRTMATTENRSRHDERPSSTSNAQEYPQTQARFALSRSPSRKSAPMLSPASAHANPTYAHVRRQQCLQLPRSRESTSPRTR